MVVEHLQARGDQIVALGVQRQVVEEREPWPLEEVTWRAGQVLLQLVDPRLDLWDQHRDGNEDRERRARQEQGIAPLPRRDHRQQQHHAAEHPRLA